MVQLSNVSAYPTAGEWDRHTLLRPESVLPSENMRYPGTKFHTCSNRPLNSPIFLGKRTSGLTRCALSKMTIYWSLESKKMAGIYQSSRLTLAASWAENSNGDMASSPKEIARGIRVEGLERVGVLDDIFVRVLLPHGLKQFSLYRRPWVYQERLLSPRYLHLSPAYRVDLGMQHGNTLSILWKRYGQGWLCKR